VNLQWLHIAHEKNELLGLPSSRGACEEAIAVEVLPSLATEEPDRRGCWTTKKNARALIAALS
jgi:hypothetical protein